MRWETDDSINSAYLAASVAIGTDAPIAIATVFTPANAVGDFAGFSTTLQFFDSVLPHFQESDGKPFAALSPSATKHQAE